MAKDSKGHGSDTKGAGGYDAAAIAAKRNAAAKSGKRWGANKNKDDWKMIGDRVFGSKPTRSTTQNRKY